MSAIGVILASASPRRHDLLRLVGIAHEVVPADIDESHRPGEAPVAYAERLAREKGTLVASRHTRALVISADTIVVADGDLLGKPGDPADAESMLRRLSGRTHVVYTAVAASRGGRMVSGVEESRVTFRTLSAEEIERYVATGEPMDKAGSYGVQGYGAAIVERIEGDFFAVMGLAIVRLLALVRQLDVEYEFGAGLRALP